MRPIDIANQRFGLLKTLRYSPEHRQWECLCDCGRTHFARSDNLRAGRVKSCGCAHHRVRPKQTVSLPDVAHPGPAVAAGVRFGRLTALYTAPGMRGHWACLCDCGMTKRVRAGNLTQGATRSCGCLRQPLESLTRTQRIWSGINHAARNPSSPHWPPIGGKGLGIAQRWHDYSAFLADMGEAPDGARLSRRDPTQGFSPDNCYWRTA